VSPTIFLLTISLPLATVLLVFGMKYFSALQQTKARAAHDAAYRELAARGSQSQAETAQALAGIQAALAELDARLGNVERILRQVE
jgi:hypothetical protein